MPSSSSRIDQDSFAAFRYPEFRRFVAGSFLLTIALLTQEVALGYELYRITRDPLALGFTGLAEALPFIALSLFGGHLADRKSKRRIILWSVGTIAAVSLLLFLVARAAESARVPVTVLLVVIYGLFALIGICRAFQSPAAASLRAFLVPIEVYANAATWSSSAWQTGAIVGPMIGGFLYAWLGFSDALLFVVAVLLAAMVLFVLVGDKGNVHQQTGGNIMSSVKEGVRFVWRTKQILYAISLDLFSVLFGGVVAILPIYAQDILRVGAEGLGVLRAAPSAGAVITLIILSRISPMRRAWRNLLVAVAGFGVTILLFALSPWMWVSVAALFLSGAFDSISVVIRQTLLQLRTPDEMRGRVMAVNGIFVSSSNELGAFESGFAARLMGVVPSAVFGGVMTLVTVVWMALRARDLLNAEREPGK